MTHPVHTPDAKMIEKLSRVGYVVEATNAERFFIWQQHMHFENSQYITTWEQDYEGYAPMIGWVDDRPICLCITFATIDGMLVAFVEMTSQLADYKMMEEWTDKYMPVSAYNRELGILGKRTDARNFGHVIGEIWNQAQEKIFNHKASNENKT